MEQGDTHKRFIYEQWLRPSILRAFSITKQALYDVNIHHLSKKIYILYLFPK